MSISAQQYVATLANLIIPLSYFIFFFNILRPFAKYHLLEFTLKDFTGLSLLQISVQTLNPMYFGGPNCTFGTH